MSQKVIDSPEFPLGCELELTYKCNQQCLYCFNDSGQPKKEELSTSRWMKIVEEFTQHGVFECVLQGGEPLLLGEDLYRIMDIFYDNDVRILLVTNGTLIDEYSIDKLTKYEYSRFQVSVGGPNAAVHDYDRGSPHSFRKVINGCILASQAGLPLTISFTITKHNLSSIEEMVYLSYMVGAEGIVMGFFLPAGRGFLNASQLYVSKKQKEKARSLILKLHENFANKMNVAMEMDTVEHLRMCTNQHPGFLLIRPNGDVKLDWILPFVLGNVTEESVTALWNRIGKTAWSHPVVERYIESLESEEDLLNAQPRPHVDEDILLQEADL